MKVIKVGDSTVIKLIGDVVFFHNGAIITCDSAYRYSERDMDGMGNVIINQDSIYIYGDKVTYNGETNIAQVFAPIIKTVDGDATLYTHNMTFNTQTKIGEYYGGGTMVQNENLMESQKGIYYTDTRNVDFIGDVAMSSPTYIISTDSIGFDMNSEVVSFYVYTDIWNHEGEYLSADQGTYDTKKEIYNFTQNAYILTQEQELWADELIYYSTLQEAVLTKNIQILDTVQNLLSFGDKGRYWGGEKRVLMTNNPSTLSYDPQTNDTVYSRADTMLVYPALLHNLVDSLMDSDPAIADSLAQKPEMAKDEMPMVADSLKAQEVIDTTKLPILADTPLVDSITIDSVLMDSTISKPSLSKKELKRQKREEEQKQKELEQKQKDEEQKQMHEAMMADSLISPELLAKLEKKQKRQDRKQERIERYLAHGGHSHDHDHDHGDPAVNRDSLRNDTTQLKDLSVNVIENSNRKADSSDYIITGFQNVRIFKKDMQAICDSMVMISTDSTLHMYNNPIVWNGLNQVTAEKITVFSKDGQLYRSELDNFPIMAQAIDTLKGQYNQIKGKFMEAFFKDNNLHELDVIGNSEAIYYREEEGEIDAIMNTLAANMEIVFEQNQISLMKWFTMVDTGTYPLDMVTPEVKTMLEGFSWQMDKRPKNKNSIFTRTIRESIREKASAIPQPLFSITEGIDNEKLKYTEDGTWRDRDEIITLDKESLKNDDL